jgi:hypothetical protein
MADWFAVYQESDGKLISVGTVLADPLRPGLAKKNLGATRPEGGIWNPSMLQFTPSPPTLPNVDRVEEVIDAMPKSQGKYTPAAVRDELSLLLGPEFQFRDAFEARNLS